MAANYCSSGAGIRIVFRVTNEVVDILRIVYVLTIERRTRDMAFKIAHGRLKVYRKLTEEYASEVRFDYLQKLETFPSV
ncbi:hypothetical protein [Paenibacillus sp. PL91]|uniref:hypothetical protein n=1 Tax=Paenibacillus sp. PL91 TaxID=2729538 RepID=UPI00145DD622|nr:hypothetical protein [Paenibacillus sp. PL91]